MGSPKGQPQYWLREYLARNDVTCPGCRYNLRGLVGTACPECGGTLDMGEIVGRADRRSRRAMRVRIGLNIGLTACFFLLIPIVMLLVEGDAQGGIVICCPLAALGPTWAIAAAERRFAPGKKYPDVMLLSWFWILLQGATIGFGLYSLIMG